MKSRTAIRIGIVLGSLFVSFSSQADASLRGVGEILQHGEGISISNDGRINFDSRHWETDGATYWRQSATADRAETEIRVSKDDRFESGHLLIKSEYKGTVAERTVDIKLAAAISVKNQAVDTFTICQNDDGIAGCITGNEETCTILAKRFDAKNAQDLIDKARACSTAIAYTAQDINDIQDQAYLAADRQNREKILGFATGYHEAKDAIAKPLIQTVLLAGAMAEYCSKLRLGFDKAPRLRSEAKALHSK